MGKSWGQDCQDGGRGHSVQEYSTEIMVKTSLSEYCDCQPLPAVLGGEVSARYLSDNVAVEEAGQDQTLGTGVPLKVRQLELDYFDQTKHVI